MNTEERFALLEKIRDHYFPEDITRWAYLNNYQCLIVLYDLFLFCDIHVKISRNLWASYSIDMNHNFIVNTTLYDQEPKLTGPISMIIKINPNNSD